MFGYHENEIRALDCDGSLGICMLVRIQSRGKPFNTFLKCFYILVDNNMITNLHLFLIMIVKLRDILSDGEHNF